MPADRVIARVQDADDVSGSPSPDDTLVFNDDGTFHFGPGGGGVGAAGPPGPAGGGGSLTPAQWGAIAWSSSPQLINVNETPDADREHFCLLDVPAGETITKFFLGSWTVGAPAGLVFKARVYTCDPVTLEMTKRLSADSDGSTVFDTNFIREIALPGGGYSVQEDELVYASCYFGGVGAMPSLLAADLWNWTAYKHLADGSFAPAGQFPVRFFKPGATSDAWVLDFNGNVYPHGDKQFWMAVG